MGHSKASAIKIKAAKRAKQALALRIEGLSYAEIAERLGCDTSWAHRIVIKQFDKLNAELRESATQLQQLSMQRLEGMLSAIAPRIQRGDLKAIGAATKIIREYASIAGLKKIVVEAKVSNEHVVNVSERIDQYADQLERTLGARAPALPSSSEGDGRGERLALENNSDREAEPVPGL